METTTEERARPAPLHQHEVRAILDGRQSQFRRVMKPQPPNGAVRFEPWILDDLQQYRAGNGKHERYFEHGEPMPANALPLWVGFEADGTAREWRCPYGQPGDLLYVRETWRTLDSTANTDTLTLAYRADRIQEEYYVRVSAEEWDKYGAERFRSDWRPSIHMPRWASRITLRVTNVRVERVQDIADEDALAEGAHHRDTGVSKWGQPRPGWSMMDPHPETWEKCLGSARFAFANLWEKINGPRGYGWDANPWVWVVDFERATP